MACVHPELSGVLREELTCPVCLDVYRDPRLLPCGHNFCLGCLRRLQRQASSQRAPILCPECRQSHRCSAVAFQKNFKLANIADDYRRRGRAAVAAAAATTVTSTSGEAVPGSSSSSSSSPLGALSLPCLSVPCDYCPLPGAGPSPSPGNTESAAVVNGGGGGASVPGEAAMVAAVATPTPAVKTCLKCEVSMCGEHVRPHLELPAFREHPLSDPLGDLSSRKCPSHDEIYRYYCLDDHVCVCNACTIEGGHAGHTIKTLRNTARDMKDSLDRQLYRLERRFTSTEKKVHEQREKERQNRKFLEDAEQCLATLGEELKAKVDVFVAGLRGSAQDHADTNRRVIQKNLQRVGQDQARLQAVRCGTETLLLENDPFRFIQAYKTAKKQHRRQLRKSMFYPEYVDMETDLLRDAMGDDMTRFLEVQLQSLIMDALNQLRHLPEAGGEDGDQEGIEEGEEEDVTEEEEEDDNDDEEDEDSSEEMRSEGEEEEEEEEEAEEEEEEEDHNDSADSLYSPEEEGYEEEDGEEEEEEEV